MGNPDELPAWERRVVEAEARRARAGEVVREAITAQEEASVPLDDLISAVSAAVEQIYEPVIDRYDTALVEASREVDELELIGAGLADDQEIRARAATVAAAVLAGRDAYYAGDAAVLDAAKATIDLAVHVEAYIRDGAAHMPLGGTNA